MNKKLLVAGTFVEIAIFFLLHCLHYDQEWVVMSLATFPLAWIGQALRKLSLSGAMGNVTAWIVFFLVSLSPLFVAQILRKTGKQKRIDRSLYGMPVVFAFVLYFMVNSGRIPTPTPEMGTMILGSTFYAVIVGFLCLRIMAESTDFADFKKTVKILLYSLFFVLLFALLKGVFWELPMQLQSLEAGNGASTFTGEIMFRGDLGWTKAFLIGRAGIEALPLLVDAVLVCLALELASVFAQDAYSKEVTVIVEKIAVFSKCSMQCIIVVHIIFHLVQFLCLEKLYQVNTTVELSLTSLLFVFGAYGAANYIRKNQKMKEEQDLYI